MNAYSTPWYPPSTAHSPSVLPGRTHMPYHPVRIPTPENDDVNTVEPTPTADEDASRLHGSSSLAYTCLEDWDARPVAPYHVEPLQDTEDRGEGEAYGGMSLDNYSPYRSDVHAYGSYEGPYRSPALRDEVSRHGAYELGENAKAAPHGVSRAAARQAPKPTKKTSAATIAAAKTKAASGSAQGTAAVKSTSSSSHASALAVPFELPKPKSSAQARAAKAATTSEAPVTPSGTTAEARCNITDAPTSKEAATPSPASRSYRAAVLKDVCRTGTSAAPSACASASSSLPAAAQATSQESTAPTLDSTSSTAPALLCVPLPRSRRLHDPSSSSVPSPPTSPPPQPRSASSAGSTSDEASGVLPPHLHDLYARLQKWPATSASTAAVSGLAPKTPSRQPPLQQNALAEMETWGLAGVPHTCKANALPAPASLSSMASPITRDTPHSSNHLSTSATGSESSGTNLSHDAPLSAEVERTVCTPTPTKATTKHVENEKTSAATAKKKKKAKPASKRDGWVEVKGSHQQAHASPHVRRSGALTTSSAGGETHLFTAPAFAILTGGASATSPSSFSSSAPRASIGVSAAWEEAPKRSAAASATIDATKAKKKTCKNTHATSSQPHVSPSSQPQTSFKKTNSAEPEELLLSEAQTSSAVTDTSGVVLLGIPLRCGATAQDWLSPPPPSDASASSSRATMHSSNNSTSNSNTHVLLVWNLLKRSLAVREENATTKLLLLERALDAMFAHTIWSSYTASATTGGPELPVKPPARQTSPPDAAAAASSSSPAMTTTQGIAAMCTHLRQRGYPLQLVCAILLEASDCCADLEQSLQYAQDARDIAHCAQTSVTVSDSDSAVSAWHARLRVLEAIGRLAITRALVRVIDITGAREQLLCAAEVALSARETPLLGWIALQLGITLELCGFFSQALRVYAAAHAFSHLTNQPRLLCDVLCCQSIARSAVGEDAMAAVLHQQSVDVLHRRLPRWSHMRPMQNMVQLKLQMGNMAGALAIHEKELALAREQHDLAAVARCYDSIALAERYLQHYETATRVHVEGLSMQRSGDPRQLVECWTSAASCALLAGQPARALGYANKAARYLPPPPQPHHTRPAAAPLSSSTAATAAGVVSSAASPTTRISQPPSHAFSDNDPRLVRDYCTVAKAWVERADIYLQMDDHDTAEALVLGALEAMQGVTMSERGQYLLTATLCELDWRCCCVLQRICLARHAQATSTSSSDEDRKASQTPFLWYALQLSEACTIPGTANARQLLSRRAQQYKLPVSLFHSATLAKEMNTSRDDTADDAAWLRNAHLAPSLVTAEAVLEVLKRDDFRHRKIIFYALPWTENSLAMAYVLSLPSAQRETEDCAARRLHVEAIPLTITEEVMSLLVSASSALSQLFDAPMRTWEHRQTVAATHPPTESATETRQAARDVVYGDTPLWPQHYSSTAFRFMKMDEAVSSGAASAVERLSHDPMYCLSILYDCFMRPVEPFLFPACADGDETSGVSIVGDGIFTRIPFHALYDGEQFLTEKLDVATCASLALLCMLHAADTASARSGEMAENENTTNATEPVTTQIRVLDVAGSRNLAEARCAAGQVAQTEGPISLTFTTVDDVAAAASAVEATATLLEPFFALDAAQTCAGDESTQSAVAEEELEEGAVIAAMSCLVADQRRFVKDTSASNRLFMAVQNLDGAFSAPALSSRTRSLLELHLPVLPEVREDFCGCFVATDSHHRLAHALEIARLWNLHAYHVVLSEGCGTYGGFSIHESGVPVYRALQYAGASRLVLPVGSRTPLYDGAESSQEMSGAPDRAVVHAAMKAAASGQETVSAAMRRARCEAIRANAPLAAWATYTLCGLP